MKIIQMINTLGKDEFSDNFINVGASSIEFNKNIIAVFSNYGLKNVDIFAPGNRIYSLMPDNEYAYKSGTSMAAPSLNWCSINFTVIFP